MIRRDAVSPEGKPEWVLISQVGHARVSGDLARPWGAAPLRPLQPRDEVLAAIYHHDDGWTEWERMPFPDFATGRPLAFTEMPLEVGLSIWDLSIERAGQFGSLAAWTTAGHFLGLLSRSTDAQCYAAKQWRIEYDASRSEWFADWQAQDPAQNTLAIADQALAHLRLFDALSLWFCCAQRTEPLAMNIEGDARLSITPAAHDRFTVAPWPWTVETLELTATGHAVPVDHYADQAALAAATRRPVSICWQLEPA